MNSLVSLNSLRDAIELGPLNSLLDQLFPDVFEHIQVSDFFESEEQGVKSYNLVLALEQSIAFSIPGIDAIQLGVFRTNPDQWPIVFCELIYDGAPIGVRIKHFPLRIIIDNPLLLPVALQDDEPVLPGFAFEIEGSLAINADLKWQAQMERFSIPPFTIAGTGLLLGIEDCRLLTDADDVDDDIEELGFDQDFRGIHAQSAQFYWDLPVQLADVDLPGIRAELENLAIGNQGLSVKAELQWQVEQDGQDFDSDDTELLVSFFDSGWLGALQTLKVQIEDNVPIGTSISGFVKVPFLQQIVLLELGYQRLAEDDYQYQLHLSQGPQPFTLPLGHPQLAITFNQFDIAGLFDSDGDFHLTGQLAMTLSLPGVQAQASLVEVEYEHLHEQDNLLINLTNIDIDGIGQIEQAQLVLAFVDNGQGQSELAVFELLATIQWQDISSRINLAEQADWLPLPPDDAEVSLSVSWQDDQMRLSIHAAMDDVDQLWRFIPESSRPEVADASIDIQLSKNGADFDGELGVSFDLRLPDLDHLLPLQLSQFIEVDSGDDEGWIGLSFHLQIEQDENGEDTAKVSASLENPIAIALQLPGLELPEAPIQIAIDSIGLALNSDADDTSGKFEFSGQFELHPVLPDNLNGFVPPVIAQQLDQLLAIAHSVDLSGNAEVTLGFSQDNLWFSAKCGFEQASLELDLFDMLTGLLSGSANAFDSNNGAEIDLDIDVGIELKQIALSIGNEDAPSDENTLPFSFGMAAELRFAGQFAEFEFELSEESLSFGLAEATIPIAIPKLPLSLADLDRLKDANGHWDYQNLWLSSNGIEQQINSRIEMLNTDLEEARDLLEQLLEEGDAQAIFQQQFRVIPQIQSELFQLNGRKFLYEAILAVHQMLGLLGVEGSQQTYQTGIEVYQGAVDVALGWLHGDTQLHFKISDAKFVLPFNNPSDIRVEGGASIIGFAPDDPLVGLSELQFKLGISADAIYFAVEGGANPIPLPDFGRYPGSTINIDKLAFGYGYSKNSLKIDFAGELILSPQLVADADTSKQLGFGIRLPTNNKLQFKLDLIPVTLGEVDFVIPLVAFDIDLRSDVPPPAPLSNGLCQPHWDGLQVIAQNALRADFKRFKVSPFLGPILSTNITTSFDFQVGNEQAGISHICDGYFVILPMTGAPTIPFLNDGVPYFDRYCSSIRLGGFGLSFDLTRPFPHPSPLIIFELMGFISDPSIPIDPNGHIANIMYAELFNARISVPQTVQEMFPVLSGVVNKDFSGKINVATVIALGQNILQLVQQVIEQVGDNTQTGLNWISQLQQQLGDFTPKDVLALLPAELRHIELQGRFVNFDASASFWLLDASDFAGNDTPSPSPSPLPPPESWELLYDNNFKLADLSDWQVFDYGMKRGKGDWKVEVGKLWQMNNVGDNSPARYGSMLIYQKQQIGDLRLQVSAQSKDNDGLGVVFHLQDKDTFYRFRMTQEQKQWDLVRLNNGKVTPLHHTESEFKSDSNYVIRVETRKSSGRSIGLNRSLSRSDALRSNIGRAALNDKLKLLKNIGDKVNIKVWVNDELWCDITDEGKTLTHGYAGLDSWWNKGLQFDDFQLWQRKDAGIALGKSIEHQHLTALSEQLSQQDPILDLAFAGFDEQDIASALGDADEFAVVVSARVKLFGSQQAKMLGRITSDGRFKLMSRLDIDSLQLPIAGLENFIALQAVGRIQLSGHRAGADSWARIDASAHADWQILGSGNPEQAVARLLLGSEANPVTLSMTNELAFAIKGNAELRLFAGQIIISGYADISQSHVLVAGELVFDPNIQVFGNTKVMQLHLNCEGRVGPGQIIELSGAGQLSLLGKAFSSATVQIGYKKLQLHAALSGNNQNWNIAGLALTKVQMQLAGLVDFSTNQPEFAFAGEGSLSVLGASIEGNCKIEANSQHWLMATQGKLFWQGRNWLDSGIAISDAGLTVQGKADFGLDLTPQLPAGIELAGLYFNAAVSGKFDLNAQGQLLSWQFDLNWQLGIKLPGMQTNQLLPIASQQFKVQGSHSPTDSLMELINLININGLTLLDLGSVTLPIPQLDFDNGSSVYLHNTTTINPDGDGFSFTLKSPFPPSLNELGNPDGNINGMPYWNIRISKNLPAVTLPIPVLSNEPQSANQTPLFVVPELTAEKQQFNLGQIRLDNVHLNLKLAWKEGELGIWIANENQFVSFKKLQLFPIGLIGGLSPIVSRG